MALVAQRNCTITRAIPLGKRCLTLWNQMPLELHLKLGKVSRAHTARHKSANRPRTYSTPSALTSSTAAAASEVSSDLAGVDSTWARDGRC